MLLRPEHGCSACHSGAQFSPTWMEIHRPQSSTHILFSWAHCLVCVSHSRRRLLLHPTPVQQPSLSLGVDLAERVSPQLTCQAWVSSSRLAASVPSGSISSSSASLLLVPRRPADIPVGQEDLWGKPPSPNFPGYQSPQEWGGKRGSKGALCLVVLLPLSQPTEPPRQLSGAPLGA